MILNKEQQAEFEELSRQLIKWLNDNCHPHVVAIVEPDRASISEVFFAFPCENYIKD